MAKRQRHVFDKDMVAHVWAQQTQDDGRSSHGNFYFSGRTIYSYGRHFPIATFFRAKKNGPQAVLFTLDTYSNTTSGHVSMTRSACSQFPVFHTETLKNMNLLYSQTGVLTAKERDAIFLDYKQRIKDALIAAANSRRYSGLESAEAIFEEAKKFATFCGLKKVPFTLPDDMERRWAEAKENEDRLAKIREKREETERKKREAYAERELKKFREDPNELEIPYACSEFATDEDRELSRQRLAGAVENWKRGEIDRLPHGFHYAYNTSAMLRVKGDEIETSRGAKFPVEHGKRAFPLIRACKQQQRTWERNGHSIHLGHFTVDRVSPEGNVNAGCHFVEWSEIERVAKELGIFEQSAEVINFPVAS